MRPRSWKYGQLLSPAIRSRRGVRSPGGGLKTARAVSLRRSTLTIRNVAQLLRSPSRDFIEVASYSWDGRHMTQPLPVLFLWHRLCSYLGTMKHQTLAFGMTLIALLSAATGCDRRPSGSDAHSTATGERDQRIGNDPKEQNTGIGSNPSEEITRPTQPTP